MMQRKKILHRSLFITMAAASLTVAPAAVKADGEGPTGTFTDAGVSEVTVDGTTGVLTAKSGEKEVLVATGKANVKKGTITVSSWDVYEPESGSVKVDLSKLKNTSDNYLVIGTNKTENVSIVKIPVAAKITKVKFDASKAVLQAGHGASSSEAALKELTPEEGANYEYRTAYSQWTDMVSNSALPDFKFYQENGTQLYVRLKGGNQTTIAQQDDKEKLAYNGQTDAIPVYVAPHLPGKEVKVTIAAKAKGPSVTADYTNGTIKLPKSTEWRLVTENSILPADGADAKYLTALTDGKAQSVTDIFKAANAETIESAGLEVRKIATEKKAASKWNRLTMQKLKDLEANKDYKEGPAGTSAKKDGLPPGATTVEQKYDGGGIKDAAIYEDNKTDSSVFKIEYATTGTKTKTNIIKITNSGRFAYEIRIGAKDATTAPTEGKATKVAAATTRPKTVTMKNVSDLSTVWIRKAGDKKTKTWATNWAKLGVVDYPYVVPAQTPTTPAGDSTITP